MIKVIVVGVAIVTVVFWLWHEQRNDFWFDSQSTQGDEEVIRETVDPFETVNGVAPNPDSKTEQLTYSNTMHLGSLYQGLLKKPVVMLGENERRIALPPFPANTSLRTQRELELLHQYQELRTPERVAEIEREVYTDDINIGPETIGVYTNSPRYRFTGQAVQDVLEAVEPIVLRFKVKFDRVRPNKLDSTLTTVIDVPEHPAYPSGHSTQAHAVAFLLGSLAPERRAEFEADALRVAVNREVAGLHYPSDTAAGRLLARQIVDLMRENPDFSDLVKRAQVEWAEKQ